MAKVLPVLSIGQFDDYNHCHHCENGFYIREFDRHLADNAFLDKPHGHDFFIVLLITQGSGKHVIDAHTYEVLPGALFIITPGQIHHWDLSANVNGYILFFSKEYLVHDFPAQQLTRLPFFHSGFHTPAMQAPALLVVKMIELFRTMDTYYTSKGKFGNEFIRLYLKVMLLEIERSQSGSPEQHTISYHQNLLIRFEKLVESRFKEHWAVTQYAAELSISVKQLTSLSKRFLNKTPGELILERLVLEAKRLLLHSDQPVFAVADQLQYQDHSYFIRLFKKATGYTPEQFRQQTTRTTFSDTLT